MIDGDAFVAAITTKGTEISQVVHLGRRPTALQQTALEYLTGGVCSIEGCHSSARLEIDHVADWATTRRTELAELAPACGHHHDLTTHRGYRFGPLQPNGTRTLIPPDQRDEQRPPGDIGPPDLTIVEQPSPLASRPTSRSRGTVDPDLAPPRPSSLERRARAAGRGDQGAFFDTG